MTILPKITSDYIVQGVPKQFNTPINVGDFVIQQLKKHGNSVILVDSANGKQLTAADVLQEIVTVAEKLVDKGVRVGDVVGICSENRLEYAAPCIAVLALGATCAPLNPQYTARELKHTMSISQPSIVFCSAFTAPKMAELKQELSFLTNLIVFGEIESEGPFEAYKDLLIKPGNVSDFRPSKFDYTTVTASVMCSSGTTGLPKCVELTHYNLMCFVETQMDERISGSLENEVVLGLIPLFHGFGFGVMLLSLARNIKVVIMSMFQEKLFLESIQNHKVSLLFAVPPLLVILAKHPLVDEYDLSCIKQIRCGAAPLSKDVQLAVQKRLNISDIKQGYGMTELSLFCVLTPKDRNKFGSSGVVIPGMECKVVSIETGEALPPLKEGELCFRGPLVMKGYMKNKKATEETIDKRGWLHTGDIGYYDYDGFIYIVDRLKELIKYKGFQVAPAELEALLLTNSDIKDAAVIGIPDDEAGELPFAFVVRQADSSITAQEIQKFVSDRVSAQKRLAGGVRFVDEVPKNPSGKILRRKLRALYKAIPVSKL